MDEDVEGFLKKAQTFEKRLAVAGANKENLLLASHHDADGICAAAIIAQYILKKGGHCQLRTASEPNSKFLERVKAGRYDLVLFLDLCSGLSTELTRSLGDKWLVVDHHQLPKSEQDHDQILNPWQFGIDGDRALSTAGGCYFICERDRTSDTAFLAIAGALSDREDQGPRRSLLGLNAKILEEDSSSFKVLASRVDLLFWGKETRPVHESISSTVATYIPGLTGNKDACLASLRGAGIELKSGTRWKTLSGFSEEEKQLLLECVVPHLSGSTNTVEDLVGTVYQHTSQDEYSLLRDARDAASLLSACGRMGRASLAISLCLGGDGTLAENAERAFAEYRIELIRTLQNVMAGEERIQEKNDYLLIVGDGLVAERMTGAVCQFIASYSRTKNKVVLLRTTTQDGDVKVSARLGREAPSYDLGKLMRQVATAAGGVGGGHHNSAGARFSIVKQQEFQAAVDESFQSARRK